MHHHHRILIVVAVLSPRGGLHDAARSLLLSSPGPPCARAAAALPLSARGAAGRPLPHPRAEVPRRRAGRRRRVHRGQGAPPSPTPSSPASRSSSPTARCVLVSSSSRSSVGVDACPRVLLWCSPLRRLPRRRLAPRASGGSNADRGGQQPGCVSSLIEHCANARRRRRRRFPPLSRRLSPNTPGRKLRANGHALIVIAEGAGQDLLEKVCSCVGGRMEDWTVELYRTDCTRHVRRDLLQKKCVWIARSRSVRARDHRTAIGA